MPGKVIKGDYSGKAVGLSVSGKKAYIFTKTLSLNKKTWLELSSDNVKSVKLINEDNPDVASSAVKEAVFGTAAAINSKKVVVLVEFKDGKKSIIECDKKTYKAIQINCFDI